MKNIKAQIVFFGIVFSLVAAPFAANAQYAGGGGFSTPAFAPRGGHGGTTSVSAPAVTPTAAPAVRQGKVLGAATFQFTNPLKMGLTSDEVKQLQEKLRAEGYFTYPTSTGYFGPITLAAVKAFQNAKKLPVTGFVGPLTIGELNK